MARSAPWRRRCPSDVAVRLELAQRATLYIVHQTGPTAFVVQEETGREKKSKVCSRACVRERERGREGGREEGGRERERDFK